MPRDPARNRLRHPAAAIVAAFALLVVAAAVLLAVHRPPAGITPPGASGGKRLGGAPAPPAELESGYTLEQSVGTPPNLPANPRPDRQPPRRVERIPAPRVAAPSPGLRPPASGRASAPAALESEVARSQQPSSGPGLLSPSTQPPAASPAPPAEPTDIPPAAPSALPSARPAPSVLTPPVPVALDPPPHPGVWHVVVETPGLVAEAQPAQASARVRLRLLVREDGSVGRVEVAVSSGRPELDGAAAAAARSWRFLPARRDGSAIASTVLIWVSFVVGP